MHLNESYKQNWHTDAEYTKETRNTRLITDYAFTMHKQKNITLLVTSVLKTMIQMVCTSHKFYPGVTVLHGICICHLSLHVTRKIAHNTVFAYLKFLIPSYIFDSHSITSLYWRCHYICTIRYTCFTLIEFILHIYPLDCYTCLLNWQE